MSGSADCIRYTVGWVCAIFTEYVAAKAFLDETHDGPKTVSPNDTNTYTLGKIGAHNVVIAALPDGEYGISAAATVATNMVRSFPNVRIGLMVGIGGGAPSPKHDIRLGDVVVSSPMNGKAGVFQYDFGKALQNESFQYTGYMNLPPTAVRTAISDIRSQYALEGHRLEETIEAALQRFPRLRGKFQRSDADRDRLYQPWVVHGESCCQTVYKEKESGLVLRPPRTSDEDNPAIHYGLIASGSTLMKDANIRDALAEEHDILCFEMEAAGLMNSFPCLVIRGICDYADSHKNDEWQGYAAMAAAAYAKDLLKRILVERVDKEKAIIDILADVDENLKQLQAVTDTTAVAVQELNRREVEGKVERWLKAPDVSTNHNNATSQRMEDSGLWFLQHDRFVEWKQKRNSFLLLSGFAGCGKTILGSTIINHLQISVESRLLYFYFDFNDTDKQTLDNMLRSLIHQLAHKQDAALKDLESLFSTHRNGRSQPSREELCTVFIQMIKQCDEVWIVLDALDECSTRKGHQTEGLLSWMKDLVMSRPTNIHMIVTSRLQGDIESEIPRWAGRQAIFSIQNDSALDDIRQYVRRRVLQGEGFRRWHSRPDVQKEIESRLMEKADGMFRWAACQLDRLENCLDYPMLQKALASIPGTLCETYTRMLHDIPPQFKQNAIRILQLLTYSEHPLKIEEVVDAIAVDLNANPRFKPENRMPVPQEVSRYCMSLIVVVSRREVGSSQQETLELRLAHFSVKEYLLSDQLDTHFAPLFQDVFAQTAIASVCVAYLLHFDHCLAEREIEAAFPFARYCAKYWIDHAARGNDDDEGLHGIAMEFFLSNKRTYFDEVREPRSKSPVSGLYHASAGGLENIAKALIERGVDINQKNGEYGNALQAAAFQGHKQIVHLLLENGANVNAFCEGYALDAASFSGHLEIVQMLLDNGADLNSQDALHRAAGAGHEAIVELLLNQGIDVNIPGGNWSTELDDSALYLACENGHDNIVRMLLDHGAETDTCCGEYTCALMAATHHEYKEIIKMLLEHGADTEIEDGDDGTPLHVACSLGFKEIVEMLLDNGANIDAKDDYGRVGTPLQVALGEGHDDIAQILITRGADVNGSGGMYGNALCNASSKGDERLVRLLLDNGADIEVEGKDGNALQAACSWGQEEIVRLLLERGANIDGPGGKGAALQTACSRGREEIVRLLLAKGADINAPGGWDGTALEAACQRGHEKITQLLLDMHMNLNSQRECYDKALIAASGGGNESIVRMLLCRGADANAKVDTNTPLLKACSWGKERIVQILLDHGADVNARVNESTPLLEACSRGKKRIVQILLDHGADVNARVNKSTPLLEACFWGKKKIVQILLDHGADVNCHEGQETPLSVARAHRYGKIVQILLDYGADASVPFKTALQNAVQTGEAETVKLLLRRSNDADSLNDALVIASDAGRLEMVKLLLDLGADINTEKGNVLFKAVAKGSAAVVQLLLDRGADSNLQRTISDGHKDMICGNALYIASENGHSMIVQLLLDRGADLNAINGDYGNALFVASVKGQYSVANVLLQNGADPNVQGTIGWAYNHERYPSILHSACAKKHESIVRILLEHGANPNAAYEGYGNALFLASLKGNNIIARLLLERGADINTGGFTTIEFKGKVFVDALQAASLRNDTETVQLLLDNGFDINSECGHYGTALQAACAAGAEVTAMFLLDKGAGINVQSGYFGNAVQAALAEGYQRIARALFKRGAFIDPDGPGYENAVTGHYRMYELLKEMSDIPIPIRGRKRRHSDVWPPMPKRSFGEFGFRRNAP